jgi:hypothetical protein
VNAEEVIERLESDLAPVRRLPSPGRALLIWLAVTLPALAAVVWAMGPLADLPRLLSEPAFLVAEGFAAATALTAAYAAFCAGMPDEPAWKLWLPVAVLGLWVAELGRQCFVIGMSGDGAALALRPDWMCVPAIAVGGLIPALAIVRLLRGRAEFRAARASLCGALAAAAAAEGALRLFHAEDTLVMVLVWQMGSVALFAAAGGALARLSLRRPRTAEPA